MVLLTILVPTINAKAESYVADDSQVVSANIHETFKNYFSPLVSYQYFPYSCNYGSYSRTCYYGIDENFNYLKIDYQSADNSYEQRFSTGTDTNFSVTGENVYKKSASLTYTLIITIVFLSLTILMNKMIGRKCY